MCAPEPAIMTAIAPQFAGASSPIESGGRSAQSVTEAEGGSALKAPRPTARWHPRERPIAHPDTVSHRALDGHRARRLLPPQSERQVVSLVALNTITPPCPDRSIGTPQDPVFVGATQARSALRLRPRRDEQSPQPSSRFSREAASCCGRAEFSPSDPPGTAAERVSRKPRPRVSIKAGARQSTRCRCAPLWTKD